MPATAPRGAAVMRFIRVQQARVRGFAGRGEVSVFLQLEGGDTGGIALIGNDFSNVHTVAKRGDGVAVDAVREIGSVNRLP